MAAYEWQHTGVINGNHQTIVFQVLGLLLHLNKTFLGLGITITEINIKKVQKQEIKGKKNIKNVNCVEMACQKVYKQGKDDSIKAKVNIKAIPHSYIFFTLQL